MSDLDPSGIYKQTLDFKLVVEIVTDEDSSVTLENSAPQIESLQRQIIVFAGTESVEVIGLPYDRQSDDFYVAAWGLASGTGDEELERPDWI